MENYKSPYYVDFSVTPYCNLKCKFCSASAAGKNCKEKIMSLDKIEDIFTQFDRNNILRVSIEGGEPFVRDDIIDIIKLADKHIFSYYINTNGTLITEKMAEEISKTRIEKICISIDGPEKIHDLSRGVKGTFKRMLDSLKYLQKYDVPVDAIITLTKINRDYIIETLEMIKELGIDNVAMMLLAAVGKAADNMKDVYLDIKEWKSLLLQLSNLKKNGKIPVNLNIVPTGESKFPWEIYLPLKQSHREEDLHLWVNEKSISSLKENDFGCTAGKDNFAVDGYGNVYGCSLMISEPELIAGNILEDSLDNIWNNSRLFQKMRQNNLTDLVGDCKNCDLLDKCQAGCRACAFSLTKSLVGSDRRCPICK